jgi:hypothetical protein
MWVQILVSFALSVVLSYLNRPKLKNAKPAGFDEVKAPTAEVGREIPVLFGTRNVSSANVVWYGDYKTQAIKEKVSSGGLFGGSEKVTVGYKYFLGIHCVLTHGPADSITKIEFENKTAWTGNVSSGSLTVNSPSLFGGDKQEGGVSGTIDFLPGSFTQGRNAYLESKLGADVPAFRGVTSVVLRQFYIGNSPYIKTPTFWIKRIPKGWNEANSAIGVDANPIHIIRECLTNKEWGLGYPSTDIDNTSFTAAAATMVSETFGLSLMWDRSKPINEFITDILSHIDGSLYVDRSTGLFTVKLSRNDYNVNTIPALNETNIIRIDNFKRQSIAELKSSVSVVYYDNTTGEQNSVTVQETALANQQGGAVGGTNQYVGIGNSTLAAKVAARDLQALSIPLAGCSIVADRTVSTLNVGDVFTLTWPRYGISGSVFRVVEIDLGVITNNEVTIKAVEDVFSYSTVSYVPSSSEWTSPVSAPSPVTNAVLFEAGYYDQLLNGSAVDTVNYALVAGAAPTSDAISADIYTDTGSGYVQSGQPISFCPIATITSAYKPNATTLAISGLVDIENIVAGSYALIRSTGNYGNYNDEFVSVTSVTSSQVVVGRGVLDTTPVSIAANSKIYFLSDFWGSDGVDYATSATVLNKLLTVTGIGVLAIGSASALSKTIVNRVAKPYPPGRLRINTLAYPDSIVDTVANSPPSLDLVISWAHRNRISQGTTLTNTEATGITAETGVTYDVELVLGGSVVDSQTGLSGTSATFTVTTNGTYTAVITAKRSGTSSFTPLFWTFDVEIL